MTNMLDTLTTFVECTQGNVGKLNWFAEQFVTIISRRLETEGPEVSAQLSVLSEAIDIFSTLRPTLPNNDKIEKLTKTLFIYCAKVILSDGFQQLDKKGNVPVFHQFRKAIDSAIWRTYVTGHSHRFELLQYLLKNHWQLETLQQLMMGLPCDEEKALAFIEAGETPEMLHVRVELLLQKGHTDLALNLVGACVRTRKYWYDTYLRAVQLHLLYNKAQMESFTKQCQQLSCCKGLEMARQVRINSDSDLYLCLLQTVLIQDWISPLKHCCTKELLGLWLEARHQVETTEQGFLETVSTLVLRHCSTWQLMMLVDVMHSKFGKHFMQFYLEVCLKVMRKDRALLEEARALHKQAVVEASRSSLTYICTVVNCVAVNWSWRLRALALLAAMSLEPSDELMDLIDALYDTTEELHDCHLVESPESVQTDVRGRPFRRKKLTKFELRAATICSKDGYVFIPETPDKKQAAGSKTIRRRLLHLDGSDAQPDDTTGAAECDSESERVKPDSEQQSAGDALKPSREERSRNPNCVCHIDDQCPCGKEPGPKNSVFNGKLPETCSKSAVETPEKLAAQTEGSDEQKDPKYFPVRDVLSKTSQELIDILNDLLCPDLRPDQPLEELLSQCESHLRPPPHSCLSEVFEGVATSDVEQTDAADEEVFNPRPGATKWVFDGEDLDAPEPKFERRGRKPKKLLEDHAEIASSSTDNDEPARAKESVKTENVDRPRRERSRKKWSYEEVDLDFASSDEDEVVQDSDDTLSDSDVDVERFDPAPPYRHPRVKDVRAAENARMRAQLQLLKKTGEMPKPRNKDVIHRETVMSNFDRVRNQMKKRQEKSKGAATPSAGASTTAVQPGKLLNMAAPKLSSHVNAHAASSAQKEQPVVSAAQTQPHVTKHQQKAPANPAAGSNKLQFPTWDASLRQVTSGQTLNNPLKDYHIPKKPADSRPPTSTVQTQHENSSQFGAQRASMKSNLPQVPSEKSPSLPPPSVAFNTSVQHGHAQTFSRVQQLASKSVNRAMVSPVTAERATKKSTDGTQYHTSVVPQYPSQHQGAGHGAAASRSQTLPPPPHPTSVNPGIGAQQRTVHEGSSHVQSVSSASHTPVQGDQRVSTSGGGSHAQTHTPSPHFSSINTVLQTANERLPPNITITKVEGPPPPNTIRLPATCPQVREGHALSQQVAGGQSTVYLGSVPAQHNGPWPTMPTTQPSSSSRQSAQQAHVQQSSAHQGAQNSIQRSQTAHAQPVPSGAQQFVQHRTAQPHPITGNMSTGGATQHRQQTPAQPAAQNPGFPVRTPPASQGQGHNTAAHRANTPGSTAHAQHLKQSLPTQTVTSQHTTKSHTSSSDSDVESYFTHHSPVVTPQRTNRGDSEAQDLTEQDIELRQHAILSSLRKQVGLPSMSPKSSGLPHAASSSHVTQPQPLPLPQATTASAPGTQPTSSVGHKDSATHCGTQRSQSSSSRSLASQIGRVIDNVVRSGDSRLKDVKSKSSSQALNSTNHTHPSRNETAPTSHVPYQNGGQKTESGTARQTDKRLPQPLPAADSEVAVNSKLTQQKSIDSDAVVRDSKCIITMTNPDSRVNERVEIQIEIEGDGKDGELEPDLVGEQAGQGRSDTEKSESGEVIQHETSAPSDAGSGAASVSSPEGGVDALPREGRFRLMALSPAASSLQVLEGTNVEELLESVQGDSHQEVLRAQRLQVKKGESIEDMLRKLEGSETHPTPTAGTKKSWGCSFKQGVYSVEINQDRSKKYNSKKISAEDLKKEPISEMAGREGVRVVVLQVKKSPPRGAGSAAAPPPPPSWVPVKSSQPEDEAMDLSGKTSRSPRAHHHAQHGNSGNSVTPAATAVPGPSAHAQPLVSGKQPSPTAPGGLCVVNQSSLRTCEPATAIGDRTKQTASETALASDGPTRAGPSTQPVNSPSPEQIVTIRPQYGASRRLIPQLTPFRQKLQEAAARIGPVTLPSAASSVKATTALQPSDSTGVTSKTGGAETSPRSPNTIPAGKVRAVFTVAGPAGSPHLKKDSARSSVDLLPKPQHVKPDKTCGSPTKGTVHTEANKDDRRSEAIPPWVHHRHDRTTPTNTSTEPDSERESNKPDGAARPVSPETAATRGDPAKKQGGVTSGRTPISHQMSRWQDVVLCDAEGDYRCKLCGNAAYTCGKVEMMGKHITKKHSHVLMVQGSYLCPLCDEPWKARFASASEIKHHLRERHNNRVVIEKSPVRASPPADKPEQSEAAPVPKEVSPESLSDEEISFKLSTEERERALQAQQWPSSPEEELHVVPQQATGKRRGRPPKSPKAPPSKSAASKKKAKRKSSPSPDVSAKHVSRHDATDETTPRKSTTSPDNRGTKRRASPSPTSSLPGRPARKNTLNQRLQQRTASQESPVALAMRPGDSGQRSGVGHAGSSESAVTVKEETEDAAEGQSDGVKKRGRPPKRTSGEIKCDGSPRAKVATNSGVAAGETNAEGSNGTVDLKESEHVSVIKRHKSPEVYRGRKGKKREYTDWAKHAEQQQKIWEALRDSDEASRSPRGRDKSAEKTGTQKNETKTPKTVRSGDKSAQKAVDSVCERKVEVSETDKTEPKRVVNGPKERHCEEEGKNKNGEHLQSSLKTAAPDVKSVNTIVSPCDEVKNDVKTTASPTRTSRRSSVTEGPPAKKRHVRSSDKAANGAARDSIFPANAAQTRVGKKGPVSPEGLWSGNVRPGHRDWRNVKTYERRKKASDKMGSHKRSGPEEERSEDEAEKSSGDKESKDKTPMEVKTTPGLTEFLDDAQKTAPETELKDAVARNDVLGNESPSSKPKPEQATPPHDDGSSLSPPRTPPCAVSITRLNIKSVDGQVSCSSTVCRKLDQNTLVEPRDKSKPRDPKGVESEKGDDKASKDVLPSEVSPVARKDSRARGSFSKPVADSAPAQQRSTRSNSGAPRSENPGSGTRRHRRSESVSSDATDSQVGEGVTFPSPPRVTRSKEVKADAAGHGRNLGAAGASEVVSGSLLQGRARPIVIGGRVVGEPLAEQQQQQQNTRRSARAQSSGGETTREERRSTSGRRR